MRVAIEARALSAGGGSIYRYTRQLIEGLIKLGGQHEYSIIVDSPVKDYWPETVKQYVVKRHSDLLLLPWLEWQVARKLRQLKPQVVHYTKAAIPLKKEVPTVVTVYDIIPILLPSSQSWSRRLYWPLTLRHAVKHSDHVLTISQASKRDMVQQLGVDPQKITVTPLAANRQHFQPAEAEQVERLKKNYGLVDKYILYVGTIEMRKNISALLRIFNRLVNQIPHQLVLAGKLGQGGADIISEGKNMAEKGRLKFLEYVAENDLPTLYSGAEVFVWPSVYEGWGLPPLEAMACGIPVIVSNGGALPEVVGQAGVVVPFAKKVVLARLNDHDFEERFAKALAGLITDKTQQESFRQAGYSQAAKFSWDDVVRTTLKVYEQFS